MGFAFIQALTLAAVLNVGEAFPVSQFEKVGDPIPTE